MGGETERYTDDDNNYATNAKDEFEADPDDGRTTWNKKIDFLLHTIGFAVDLANIWRFPFLCYIFGGGAFLIPYFLMLFLGAAPLYYLELIIGQFNRESCVSVWRIVPVFKGVGIAQLMISAMVASYYIVINAWAIFYFFQSFNEELPWMSCSNTFNTKYCATMNDVKLRGALKANVSKFNETMNPKFNVSDLEKPQYFAATEYFERGVLGLQESKGLHDLGGVQWRLALCLLLAYLVLFLALRKGIKSSIKLIYFTATMPYIILVILLINGMTLEGSDVGVTQFITPDLSKLSDLQCWIAAAVQIFYSMGAGFGVHISLASHNRRDNNCYRDFLITATANSAASLLSGFVVFAYLGHMAHIMGKAVSDVAAMGPGLVFTVYPFAVGTLPAAPFWSALFFLLVTTLGMDTAICGFEAILIGVADNFKSIFRKFKHSRQVQTLVFVIVFYFISLIITTKGGFHVLTLLDTYAAGASLMFAALCQGVAISWFYGMRQICADAKAMLGFSPGIYWRICWKIIGPLFVGAIIILSFVFLPPYVVEYGAWHPELFPGENNYTLIPRLVYEFPTWATSIGWTLTAIPMLVIVAVFIFQIVRYKSFIIAISPTQEHEVLKNNISLSKRSNARHWFSMGALDWWPGTTMCGEELERGYTLRARQTTSKPRSNGNATVSQQDLVPAVSQQSVVIQPRVYF